jgi:hypothetical protein
MSVSSVRRRYLGLRTPTVRPMGTTTVTLRRWDMVLRASDLTTRDGFNWSDAHLSIFPILSRNPVDSDCPRLSHRRQHNCMFEVAVCGRESEALYFSDNKRWVTNKSCILGESTALGL